MKKPQLYLALSGTLTLMQAGLPMLALAQDTDSIWQRAADVSVKKASPVITAKKKSTNVITKQTSRTISGAQGHAMLLLSSNDKGQDDVALGSVPTAALTIHPSMIAMNTGTLGTGVDISADAPAKNNIAIASKDLLPAPALAAKQEPQLIASSAQGSGWNWPTNRKSNTANGLKAPHAKHLLAQLAPDQLIAQADQKIPVTPIPSAATGTVDLEEFKSTNVVDLKVSQSRTFKLKNKIVRTSISDPGIAEPVVVAENQIVLLGKNPGGATLVLWDDAGNSMAVDIRVSRDYSQLQAALREIDPRIIVKAFSVGGSDRVLLLGDVDHPESVIRAFGSANVFMDDRGMNIQVANGRLVNAKIGENAASSSAAGGGQTGQLAQLTQVDKYTFFPNIVSNISKSQVMTSDGGRVTSLIKVRKVPLIVLHVTFMEMNSVAARDLGAQLGLNFTTNHFTFGLGGNNSTGIPIFSSAPPSNFGAANGTGPFTVAPTGFVSATTVIPYVSGGTFAAAVPTNGIGQAVLNGPSGLIPNTVLLGAPGGAVFGSGGLANTFFSGSSIQIGKSGILSLNPTIQGIITHSRARILAEPTLVTISGERASFLAGGEIPIIQATAVAGATQQSVVFEPFGLRLNIIPALMENGSINLEIAPEERLVDNTLAFQPTSLSSSIPGFTTRKAQTIVEMKPGQELFIAGLISMNNGRDMIKTPVLGEVPVLGALYRSKSFNKNESELIVAVRPEIILPGSPGQLKLPEEIGRVEGPRDTNLFQVEPTVIDERHYTTGRSERVQKTSPVLPEGSPIPDNE